MTTLEQAFSDLRTLSIFGTTSEISRYVVYYVGDLVDNNKVAELDEFIGMLDPAWPLWTGCVVLRTSYTLSPVLKNWTTYRDAVWAFNKDAPRADKLMRGLDKVYGS